MISHAIEFTFSIITTLKCKKHLLIHSRVVIDYLESTDEFEPLRFAESVSENVLPSREFSVLCWF